MVFMDSGAFIALLVSDDAHHNDAVRFHRSRTSQRWTLNVIVGETYTHLRYRFGARVALTFLDLLPTLRPTLRIERVDESLESVAEGILRTHQDAALSWVDAAALAWLRLHPQIHEVFGFDDHWRLDGHILVPNV